MKAIIVDDEKNARETIVEIINIYGKNISIVAQASNVQEGVAAIRKHQPDLVFLDVDMPDGTGFDLLKKIEDISFSVIFVTAYENYAIQAFKYSALNYILKPVDPDEFIAAVSRAEKIIHREKLGKQLESYFSNIADVNHKPQKITLKTTDDIHVVAVNDIIRCESDVNYTIIYLNNDKKIVVSQTLKEFDELLSVCGFVRPHQSHLINMNYIDRFHKHDGGYIILKDKTEIPVSVRKKEQLLKMLGQL